MDKFWPYSSSESARNCLNVTLHNIRKSFSSYKSTDDLIVFSNDCYYINPEVPIWVDSKQLRHHWTQALIHERSLSLENSKTELEQALQYYNGDFLQDYIYEEWTSLERENLKEIYLAILDKLSSYYVQHDQLLTSAEFCNRILAKDPCREDIHRRLIDTYDKLDQRDMAVKQFEKCRKILKTELEIDPSSSTLSLIKSIRA